MKFTRTLLAVSLFTAAQLVTAQAEKPDAFVQQLLEKQYPHNEKALKAFNEDKEGEEAVKQCYFKGYGETTDKNWSTNGYCMTFRSEKIVDTHQKKMRYIIFTGDTVEPASRVESGILSFFSFTSDDGKNWHPVSQKDRDIGNLGIAPKEWQWLEIGPDLYGAVVNTGYGTMGVNWSANIILYEKDKEIRETYIPTYYSNTAAGGCGIEDMDEINTEALPRCTEIEADMQIRNELSAVGGLYPIQLTVNGYEGLKLVGKGKKAKTQPIKEYKNEKFLFSYNPDKHEYITPADFPKFDEEDEDNQ